MNALFDSVSEVISSRFGIDREEITPDATFDDLGLDSLSQIELVTALGKRLGTHIDDDEMADISVISEVVAKLEENGVTAR
jgi:acyl carrier protein